MAAAVSARRGTSSPHRLILLVVATILTLPAHAWADPVDGLLDRAKKLASRLEVRPRARVPAWALEAERPFLTFVQLADVHHDERNEPFLLAALDYVNRSIAPDWVILTGDNITGPTIEHHRLLQSILDERLHAPYRIIQGDNDCPNFTPVFGSSDWSFSACGVRFIGLGLDFDVRGKGVGYFARDTLDWLSEDLRSHREEPAIVFIHEPILPPAFVDAPRLLLLLARHRNVCAVVAGHVHYDLEVPTPGVLHLTAPAVGPHPRHPLKEYRVHEDRIVVRTHEMGTDGAYAPASKWQLIRFQAALRASRGNPIAQRAVREMPPRETEYPAWLERSFNDLESGLGKLLERLEAP